MTLYAALCTRAGRSAVASVRIGGQDVGSFIDRHFDSASDTRSAQMLVGRVYFGTWGQVDRAQVDERRPDDETRAEPIHGEELVVVRLGDDEFEVHCHGGKMAANRITNDVESAGGAVLSGEELLCRQAKNLLAAEAEIALAKAATDWAAAHFLAQVRGALHAQIAKAVLLLERRKLGELEDLIQQLIAKSSLGIHLLHPFQVVIAGPPNVGKSLLLNKLLGYDRAIVFDQPGTTRDVLKTVTAWDGWLFELSDTAGVRQQTADPIERAGIGRALQSIENADVLVLVADVTNNLTYHAIQSSSHAAIIHVANKCDLLAEPSAADEATVANEAIRASAKTGEGLDRLVERIQRSVVGELIVGEAIPFLRRHQHLLEKAKTSLSAGDLPKCAVELSAIVDG